MTLMKFKQKRPKLLIASLLLLLVSIAGGLYAYLYTDLLREQTSPMQAIDESYTPPVDQADNTAPPVRETTPPQTETPAPTVQNPTWPVLLSYDQASQITAVVNKKHKLPTDYAPTVVSSNGASLRVEAATALNTLFNDARAAGLSPGVISSYRSYSTQSSLYSNYVSQYGQSQADTFSARPGHSEHQTGLAVDVSDQTNSGCNLDACFESTPFASWFANRLHTYGFIVRYQKGKDAVTGYTYEPWHLRYVGVDAATAIYNSGKTMDEYYGIEAGGY